MGNSNPTTYTISELAKEFDLTTRAIRFYEDMGLLAPTRSGPGGRSRIYSARDRTRLRLLLRAKRLGSCANSCRCWPSTASTSRRNWPNCRPTWKRCGCKSARPGRSWPRCKKPRLQPLPALPLRRQILHN